MKADAFRDQVAVIAGASSGIGKAPAPYNSPYVASKFAMHGFFDSLRIELIRHEVSVTIICPYWVVTGFHEAQMDKDGEARGPSGRAIYTEKMMSAERCAEIILQAAYKRKREVMMGPTRLIAWLKLLAPGLVDRLVIAFLRATVRRERAKHDLGLEFGSHSGPTPSARRYAAWSARGMKDLTGAIMEAKDD